MKILNIQPRGFCCGVSNAYFKVAKVSHENKGKKIYLLGDFIHNKHVINEFKSKNIILINDKEKDRFSLLKNNIPDNSIIILSAHGTEQSVYDLAKEKKCKIIDTTCFFVKKTHDIIKKYIKLNYTIFFIGVKNHPETKAIMGNFSKTELITNLNQVKYLKNKYAKSKKILVTNQTTLSIFENKLIYSEIKKYFSNCIFENEICDATEKRQRAILNLKENEVDMLLVAGDIKSNNSKKLVEIGINQKIKSYLISDIRNLKKIDFSNCNKVALTAGSSTPYNFIKKVHNYLENINNHKKNS